MDTSGRVIYCGSFSKTIAPGIRLGYVCAPQPILQKLVVCKQVADVHCNLFFQRLVAAYLQRCDMDAHLAGVSHLYARKLARMEAALAAHCPSLTWVRPEGGLFLWCRLPGQDGMDFCRRLTALGVAAVPGSAFEAELAPSHGRRTLRVAELAPSHGRRTLREENEGRPADAIRLNYSLPSVEQIDEGCRRMGGLF